MMICGFDSNKVSKSLKFCRRENRLNIPFGSLVHGHLIWSKISTFYKDETIVQKYSHDVDLERFMHEYIKTR